VWLVLPGAVGAENKSNGSLLGASIGTVVSSLTAAQSTAAGWPRRNGTAQRLPPRPALNYVCTTEALGCEAGGRR